MRPPRIAYLVVLSSHEVNDGMARPNVTRVAVTFSHIQGAVPSFQSSHAKPSAPKGSEKNEPDTHTAEVKYFNDVRSRSLGRRPSARSPICHDHGQREYAVPGRA
jgi:hypothetical protein